MTYSPHTWQPGEIISSARLNALEQGVAAGGGSYDIVVDCGNILSNDVSDYTVSWDYESVKAKVLAGELVTGVAFLHYNYDGLVDGDTDINSIPLVFVSIYSGEAYMTFGLTLPLSSGSNTTAQLRLLKLTLDFEPSDGTLNSASFISKNVNLS